MTNGAVIYINPTTGALTVFHKDSGTNAVLVAAPTNDAEREAIEAAYAAVVRAQNLVTINAIVAQMEDEGDTVVIVGDFIDDGGIVTDLVSGEEYPSSNPPQPTTEQKED